MGSPEQELTCRVAVITGSTRGLGYAMARLLGRHGAAVVVASRSEADVDSAVERLRAEGITASGRRCDTGDLADVEALRDAALELGTLDIWVNNAGAAGVYGPTASTPVDDFAGVVRTNILGTFHGSRVALPVFLAQGHGDLVNVYGHGDRGPVLQQNAYASSKRWVRQFTETVRAETQGTGVRVHGFNPGLVITDLLGTSGPRPGSRRRSRGCRSSSGCGDRPRTSPPGPSWTSSRRTPPRTATSGRPPCWRAASATS